MKVDYVIAGGGLCGTMLSRELMKAGRSVVVFNQGAGGSASEVAGGIINPVTGIRLVNSWLHELFYKAALESYSAMETELNIAVLKHTQVLDFFANLDQREVFERRAAEGNPYLSLRHDEPWNDYFRFQYGIGEIKPCLLVDVVTLATAWWRKMKDMGCVVAEKLDWDSCIVEHGRVRINDIEAEKVICCDGADGAANPYFGCLPWSRDKGEAIIVRIPGLPRHHIFKQQFGIIPWQQEDVFWIGATHDWKYTDLDPSPAFRHHVEEHLGYFLKLPFSIVDHLAARRPANLDRRPFVGVHPKHPEVGILNGMGGKGMSMAPYFAGMLAKYLVGGAPIMLEADVQRFKRILGAGQQ